MDRLGQFNRHSQTYNPRSCRYAPTQTILPSSSPTVRKTSNSNRYTVRIESLVSYRKQRARTTPNRYTKRHLRASKYSSAHQSASISHKINRQPRRVEFLVSDSKQWVFPEINRQLFAYSPARACTLFFFSGPGRPCYQPAAGLVRLSCLTQEDISAVKYAAIRKIAILANVITIVATA